MCRALQKKVWDAEYCLKVLWFCVNDFSCVKFYCIKNKCDFGSFDKKKPLSSHVTNINNNNNCFIIYAMNVIYLNIRNIYVQMELTNEAPWTKYMKEGQAELGFIQSEHDFSRPSPDTDKLFMPIGNTNLLI